MGERACWRGGWIWIRRGWLVGKAVYHGSGWSIWFYPLPPKRQDICSPSPRLSLSQQEFNFQFFRGPTTPPFPSLFCQKHAWPPSVIFSNNIGKIPSVSQSPPPSLLPLFSLFGGSHALAEMLQWFPRERPKKKVQKGTYFKREEKKVFSSSSFGHFRPPLFPLPFPHKETGTTCGQETHFRPNIASMFQEVFEENAKIFQGIFGSNRKWSKRCIVCCLGKDQESAESRNNLQFVPFSLGGRKWGKGSKTFFSRALFPQGFIFPGLWCFKRAFQGVAARVKSAPLSPLFGFQKTFWGFPPYFATETWEHQDILFFLLHPYEYNVLRTVQEQWYIPGTWHT